MKRAVVWALLAASCLLVAAGCSLRNVVRSSMTPKTSFAEQEHPDPPDYDSLSSWSAHPRKADTADEVPDTLAAADQPAADVFYIHPTSYVGKQWNAPTTEAKLNASTDAVATGVQAPVFNGCCEIWGPRYRQATGFAFLESSESSRAAIDLAYADVLRAFRHFQAERGEGRPFILAGHSQGSMLGVRLLIEEIWPNHRQELVMAVLPGAPIALSELDSHQIPTCQRTDDVACVVTYNARSESYEPGDFELSTPHEPPWACTNPVGFSGPTSRADHGGAVFPEAKDTRPRSGFASARCDDQGILRVEHDRAPRGLTSRILDHVLGPGNAHPIEVQLFFVDLRTTAAERVNRWLTTAEASQSASP